MVREELTSKENVLTLERRIVSCSLYGFEHLFSFGVS